MSRLTRDLILAPRGLSSPDGRPLCTYSVTEPELAELLAALRGHEPGDSAVSAEFCLAAAELWRRHYDGGLWTWDVVLPHLGWSAEAPTVAPLVDQGLRYWRRPLLELARREFLGSVAREAGIPLGVLTREGGAIRAFLRTLLDDLGTFGTARPLELARHASRQLPERLSNPTFLQLASDLALAARALATQLGPLVRSSTQLSPATLDAAVPTWRERLPVRLDHEATLALVTGLIDAARVAPLARPLRATVVLTGLAAAAPRLRRLIELPSRLTRAALADSLGCDPAALPGRAELVLERSGAARVVALLVRKAAPEDDAYRVEPLASADTQADEPLRLSVRARGAILGQLAVPGGDPLGDLPWVFARATEEPDRWRLVAEGSCRFDDEALVALPPGFTVTPEADPVGQLGERRLLIVTATTQLVGDGASVRLTAGGAASARVWTWRGRRLPGLLAGEAFLGWPTLEERQPDGRVGDVATDRLRVFTAGRGWERPTATDFGTLRLRAVDERGDVVHQSRLTIVPPGTRVDIEEPTPTGARVAVRGTGAAQVAIAPTPGLRLTPDGAGRWALEAPPTVGAFTLILRFTDAEARLLLPFPRRGQRFVTAAGDPLLAGTQVSLDTLVTVVAEAWTRPDRVAPTFTVEASLHAQDVSTEAYEIALLQHHHGGRHRLPLHAIERQLTRLLSLSTNPGATLRLRILDHLGSYIGAPELGVGRFAHAITIDRDHARATVPQGMDVEALYIADPELTQPLAPTARDGSFSLDALAAHPGSWMVFGMRDGAPATAPRLFQVPGAAPRSGFTQAVEQSLHLDRRAAFLARWRELAAAPADPDWRLAERYFERLDRFPASTFEALRVLPEVAPALALALLTTRDPALLVRSFDALPFHWAALSVAALSLAIERFRRHLADLTADEGSADSVLAACLTKAGDAVSDRYPGFRVALAFATRTTPALEAAFHCAELGLAASHPQILSGSVPDLITELRRRHADREFWPSFQALDGPATRFKALIDELAAGALASAPPEARPLLVAPILAAAYAASDTPPSAREAFTLRLAEAADPEYFRQMHQLALTLLLARQMSPPAAAPPEPPTRRRPR